MIDTEIKWRFDTRIAEIQTRQIREGKLMLFQSRTIMRSRDGTTDSISEWETNCSCPNYGDVYDCKPAIWERFKSYIFK